MFNSFSEKIKNLAVNLQGVVNEMDMPQHTGNNTPLVPLNRLRPEESLNFKKKTSENPKEDKISKINNDFSSILRNF